jgi:ketosteroid isomerase-like protein
MGRRRVRGKDVERIASFWTDDATITPPGAPPVVGKAAIRTFVEQSLATPGFHIGWTPAQASVSADGTLGYTTGTNTTTLPGQAHDRHGALCNGLAPGRIRSVEMRRRHLELGSIESGLNDSLL